MAELKRNFSAAKMNKDLDERLVPAGEYRDANNIEIASPNSGDGNNDVGTARTIRSNWRITHFSIDNAFNNPEKAFCVGVIADEKNNHIYSLIRHGVRSGLNFSLFEPDLHWRDMDYVLRWDTVTEELTYVFVDIFQVVLKTNEDCGQLVVGCEQNELRVEDNSSVRPGMVCTFEDGNGDIQEIVVKHLFEDDAGGTTQSTNRIFLEEDYVGTIDAQTILTFDAPRVLNFDRDNPVTGINIVDDLLMWTDNDSEPKRLNITRSIAGTGGGINPIPTAPSFGGPQTGDNDNHHTRLYAELDPTIGLECVTNDENTYPIYVDESHITTIKKAPTTPPVLEMSSETADRINPVTGETNPTHSSLATPITLIGSNGNALGVGDTITVDLVDNVHWIAGDIINATNEEPSVLDSIEDFLIRFEVVDTAVVSAAALLNTFTLQIVSMSHDISLEESTFWFSLEKPNAIFEFKFPRFAYRYKYTDGEYSPFSPWSQIAFIPGGYDYVPKKGYNLGMVNQIRSLKITDYLVDTDYRPMDIVAVDILYKEEMSPNVYTVKTINPTDEETLWPDVSLLGNARGEYEITSEMIHAVVPSNQMIRPWDNVPRVALAQTVTGNRVVYGNYLQNYDVNNKPEFSLGFKHTDVVSHLEPETSLKSIRTYQMGVVFADQYGRETPVLTNKRSGSIYLDKDFCDQKNMLHMTMNSPPPDWATHYKYYVKETSNEYYNLALDRWYNAEDGNIWLSFPSSERNKVDIDTFLILKKQHGTNLPVKDKARYKILAIDNEAPDYIKLNKMLLGSLSSAALQSTGYPEEFGTYIYVNFEDLNTKYGFTGEDEFAKTDLFQFMQDNELSVRFTDSSGNEKSDWYKVAKMSIVKASSGISSWYYDILIDGSFGTDVALTGSASNQTAHLVEFKREVVENKPEFDGRFFVKIYKDSVLEENVLLTKGTDHYTVLERREIHYSYNCIDFKNQHADGDSTVKNPPDDHVLCDGTTDVQNSSVMEYTFQLL